MADQERPDSRRKHDAGRTDRDDEPQHLGVAAPDPAHVVVAVGVRHGGGQRLQDEIEAADPEHDELEDASEYRGLRRIRQMRHDQDRQIHHQTELDLIGDGVAGGHRDLRYGRPEVHAAAAQMRTLAEQQGDVDQER